MIKFIAALAAAALLHITPTVVLVKRADAMRALLPGATQYLEREVHLSDADAHRLHEAVDWSPDEGVVVFYTGTQGERAVGSLVFVRVDTPHGPVEIAVGFDPAGRVAGVVVTKATVETRPWILEALGAGLAERYKGLTARDAPAGAAAVKDKVGSLPAYMAGQVDKGVARALAAYGAFYNHGGRDGGSS